MTNSRALAAIDVGTNSVHMVIARPVPGGSPEVVVRERMPVRLGSGGADMRRLLPDAIDRAIAALVECRHIADAHDAEVVAVATSAVREADNQSDFLRRAHTEAGVTVQVISGMEEARLIHLGAMSAVPIAGRPHVVIDIGGGSTEVIAGNGTAPALARSLKLGHIRLTDRFFPSGGDCRRRGEGVPPPHPVLSRPCGPGGSRHRLRGRGGLLGHHRLAGACVRGEPGRGPAHRGQRHHRALRPGRGRGRTDRPASPGRPFGGSGLGPRPQRRDCRGRRAAQAAVHGVGDRVDGRVHRSAAGGAAARPIQPPGPVPR